MTTEATEGRGGAVAAPVLSAAILLAALAFKFVAVGWALSRGFEIGDEGLFLLNLNHPENAPEVFQFYNLLTISGGALRFDVFDARLLRVSVELLASLVLSVSVFAWAQARAFPRGGVGLGRFLAFALLGALITTTSRSFGYNDATNFCVYVAIGGLVYLLSLPARCDAPWRRSLAAAVVGAASGFQLGVKFTSALLLFALVAAAGVAVLRALDRRERLRLVGSYSAGVVLVCLLFAWVGGGFASLYADYALAPHFSRLTHYRPFALLTRLLTAEIVTGAHLLLGAAVFLLSLRVLSRLRRIGPDTRLAGSLGVAAILLAGSVGVLHPFFIPPTLLYLSVFMLLLIGSMALCYRRPGGWAGLTVESGARPRLGPLLLLLAAPLVAMAGTNVPLTMRLPTHALPWFLAAAVLVFDLRNRFGLARVELVATTTLAVVTTVLVVQHQWVYAYGLPRPLAEQRYAVEGLEGVRVDRVTRDFLQTLAARMEQAGFRPGDPIFALDYMPGLVYFLGGVSPGWNFHWFDKFELNCFNINRARYRGRPFLLFGRPIPTGQQACLKTLDIANGYRLAARIPFPYQDLYRLMDAPGFTHVYVYAPRDPDEPQP